MQFHPYAEIFPLLIGDDFEKLKQDIESNGLQQPILLSSDGRIADGRNRYRACYELDIEPEYITHHGDDASLLHRVISLNLHRRHLTAGQRAMIALEIKPMFEAQAQDKKVEDGKRYREQQLNGVSQNSAKPQQPIDSRQESAKAVGVSHDSVSRAETIAKTSPVLKQAVQAGEVSLNKAYEATKEPELIKQWDTPYKPGTVSEAIYKFEQQKKKEEKQQQELDKSLGDYTHRNTRTTTELKNRLGLELRLYTDEFQKSLDAGQIEQSHASWFVGKLQAHIETVNDLIEQLEAIANDRV